MIIEYGAQRWDDSTVAGTAEEAMEHARKLYGKAERIEVEPICENLYGIRLSKLPRVWESIRKVFACPRIDAAAGNMKITSFEHGMGFTLEIDGKPVLGLRAVTLRMALDEPNTITTEFMPDFRDPTKVANFNKDTKMTEPQKLLDPAAEDRRVVIHVTPKQFWRLIEMKLRLPDGVHFIGSHPATPTHPPMSEVILGGPGLPKWCKNRDGWMIITAEFREVDHCLVLVDPHGE